MSCCGRQKLGSNLELSVAVCHVVANSNLAVNLELSDAVCHLVADSNLAVT